MKLKATTFKLENLFNRHTFRGKTKATRNSSKRSESHQLPAAQEIWFRMK